MTGPFLSIPNRMLLNGTLLQNPTTYHRPITAPFYRTCRYPSTLYRRKYRTMLHFNRRRGKSILILQPRKADGTPILRRLPPRLFCAALLEFVLATMRIT